MVEALRDMSDPNWWRQAVVYQIYPRSFADSNGDGVGDIPGIIQRIEHLHTLGVDAIWLSPFYPSALADGGYDVDDYRDVDPLLGTLNDFDTLMTKARSLGIKVIVDIVPNHSSNRHTWFKEALASPKGSDARNRYVFRDGKGENGQEPPTDWMSHFGGPAWTRIKDGQWYLHLFAREQPDFNWENPEVHEDFKTTLRFWSDRGVDGFRIDVAHGLTKDLREPLRDTGGFHPDPVGEIPQDGSHPLYDRNETHEIFREWRKVFNEYNPPRTAVAEAWLVPARRALYARPDELGQAFDFSFLNVPWIGDQIKATIEESLATARIAGATATWVLSNHDVVRHASRHALPTIGVYNRWLLSNGHDPEPDGELGLARARALTMLMLALPGSAYLYQGEELGLFEVADLAPEDLQDPQWERTGNKAKGRDGCRVPIPWTREGSSFGFGDGGSWLPQPAWFGSSSVEAEDGVVGSTLSMYRAALALRRELQSGESITWPEAPRDLVHFVRPNGWASVTNFSETPMALPAGRLLLSSGHIQGDLLPPNTTAWLAAEDE